MKSIVIFFSVVACLLIQPIYSQVDPKADKIIKSSRKKVNSYQDMTSDFIWTMENKATQQPPSVKKGKIYIKKDKYKVVFPEREMYCDGKNFWDYLKKEKEVNLSKNNPKEGMNFQRVFKMYDEGMKVKYEKMEMLGNANTHKIVLFPIQEKEFFKVELWIEDKTENIRKIKIHNRNGTTHQFEMNSIVVNTNLTDDMFIFDANKHQGVEVIDLREE
jgi:outer membrane lipoprotein-sorting protein